MSLDTMLSWHDHDAMAIEKCLNELADQGWEVVSGSVDPDGWILNIWSVRRITIILRRLKTSTPE